jgi:hypothetical protein
VLATSDAEFNAIKDRMAANSAEAGKMMDAWTSRSPRTRDAPS